MPRGFFFFEQRYSGRASKIVTLAGSFLQAVAHALQTESESRLGDVSRICRNCRSSSASVFRSRARRQQRVHFCDAS